jgi:hypothetical protein
MSAVYGKARQKFLEGSINWLTDDFTAVLIDTSLYTVAIDVDEFLGDIPGAALVELSLHLGGKTSTLGVADANDVTFTSTSGNPCGAIVIFKDTGSTATSPLVAYIDSATGLPVTLGGDVTVRWSSGASKIFKL